MKVATLTWARALDVSLEVSDFGISLCFVFFFGGADIGRSGPSSKRTFVKADLCRSGHWSIIKQGGGHQSIISKIGHNVNSIDSYYTKFRWQRLEIFLRKMLTHMLVLTLLLLSTFWYCDKKPNESIQQLISIQKSIDIIFTIYILSIHQGPLRQRSASTKVPFDEGPLR